MTKEERLLRQEQRERAKAIEAAAREAGRGPLDLPYLLLVLTLVGVGLIMLFSASFPSAYYEEGNPAYYLIRQGIFAILGITAMFIVGKINYERYRAVAKMLLIFSIILLVLVLIPGIGTGRRRTARSAGSVSAPSSSSRLRSPKLALSSILPTAFRRRKTKWPRCATASCPMLPSSA